MPPSIEVIMMADNAEARQQQLNESLSKIRHHTGSKLPNQKAPAQLLVAVEATLQDTDDGQPSSSAGAKKAMPSPTAYLMALLSMLEKSAEDVEQGSSGSLLSSTLYLLSLVVPNVSQAVIRAQLDALIQPLATVLATTSQHLALADAAESQAALLRSALGVLEPLLVALTGDRATMSANLQVRGCWNSTLRLCLDARPKVRRRAQDLVNTALHANDQVSDKPHPFAVKTAEWAIAALAEVGAAGSVVRGGNKGKQAKPVQPKYDVKSGRAKQPEVSAAIRQKNIDSGSANSGIWICGFLRQLAPVLPAKSVPTLTATLLRVIGQRNPFLSAAAFEVFESIFKASRPVMYAEGTASLGGSVQPAVTQSALRDGHADALVMTLDALSSDDVAPNANDIQLVVPYLRAVENAMVAYSRVQDGKAAWQRVPKVWADISTLAFSSSSKASRDSIAVRIAGREALSAIVRYCIPDQAIQLALNGTAEAKDTLTQIISFFTEALDKHVLRFSHSWPEILNVLSALVLRLRVRPKSQGGDGKRAAQPAASTLLLPLVVAVSQLRIQPKFEHREQADAVIGAAVQVCGPAAVLERIPLNLLGEDRQSNGRAWLLPLMRTYITNTDLKHFIDVLIPLSEALFNRQAEAEEVIEEGKPRAPVQAKMFEAMTEQVWALLPGYCDLPVDLTQALTPTFIELLSNVLYSQTALRPSICRALQLLVERSTSLAKSSAPQDTLLDNFGLSGQDGKRYVKHLEDLAPNLLATFFNVFSQSSGDGRGYLSDCMLAYIGIISHDEVAKVYEKVSGTLLKTLPGMPPARDRDTGPKSIPPVPHTMMDLLALLVPHLALKETEKLFSLCCSDELFASRDAGMQKKTYRTLARLMEIGKGGTVLAMGGSGGDQAGKLAELLQKIQATSGKVVGGAKRDRTALLASVMPLIPSTELHFLPSIIPEAVLATKEVNQGARELAYRLLVEMGRKASQGGKIKRHLVQGAAAGKGEDQEMEENTVSANVNEYITMVAAGLAASSPHMVSATITALARLVYEFHAELPDATLAEMAATMDVFLGSTNREIVKSALGFVKVIIVSLPASVLEPGLASMVGALFSTSSQHRVHFKAKIRHIVERLIRRFGFDRIEVLVDDDNKKLLTNIRKRKDRAKRKKAATQDGEGGEMDDEEGGDQAGFSGMGQRALKNVGVDAFEDAIYGSESDMSDDDESEGEQDAKHNGRRGGKDGKRSGRQNDVITQDYLLQDDDQPMDLLDRGTLAGGSLISAGGKAAGSRRKHREPGQEASRFTLDEETGRMVIEDEELGGNVGQPNGNAAIDVDGAGRAYLDRERGTHGFTSKDGVVRLNKNNKRNRAADDAMDEEQMALEEQLAAMIAEREAAGRSAEQQSSGNNKQRKQERKQIGSEFRAKKAGGDVKRGEVKPFAYVPLSDIGSKKKAGAAAGANKMRILGGKEKKRRL